MDQYLIIIVLLVTLAVIDLMVGVANDAVNFLNSAIGSHAAKFRTIMIIAAIGVIVGATFSSGLMEVARKGIFHPDKFIMPELIVIFIAAMLTEVLLLDLFNTFSLPTSTTVSIIFALLGGSIAVSLIKVISAGENITDLFTYINTAKAFIIIGGIFLSIVVAFFFGSMVQFISRMIFTFDYQKQLRRYGPIWGSLALTLITFFLVLKGAKSASFMTEDVSEMIKSNLTIIFLYSFIGWAIILFILMRLTKINILKLIVLAGTFALAMAFAANDLVNFIGAPLAAINSYQLAQETANPEIANMVGLNAPVKANTFILLIAGMVMVVTLFMSKKARSVAETTIALGRQSEGYERFESNSVARAVVRMVLVVFDFVKRITPEPLSNWVNKRFDLSKYNPDIKEKDRPAFDLIRASVILMVAAAIISYATYLKLPLSTTYVTFIVAMAAALPDRSWGRESAVNRVSGVITVISGWFFTALIASTSAMIIATIVYFGEVYAAVGLFAVGIYILIRNLRVHRSKEKEHEEMENRVRILEGPANEQFQNIMCDIAEQFGSVSELSTQCIKYSIGQKRKKLDKIRKSSKKLHKRFGNLNNDLLNVSRQTPDDYIEAGQLFARSMTSLHSISDHLSYLVIQNFEYVDNNYKPLTEIQAKEHAEMIQGYEQIVTDISVRITEKNFKNSDKLNQKIADFKDKIQNFNVNQLKRVKASGSNLKRSRLYFDNISNTEAIIDNISVVYSIYRDISKAMDGDTAILTKFKPKRYRPGI